MKINLPVVIIITLAVVILIVFVIKRNKKDKKEMERTMNQVDENPIDRNADEAKS